MRWRCVPKQSCPTHSQNSATAFLLGQSDILAISCFHGLWQSLVSSSCLYTLWNTCFKCSFYKRNNYKYIKHNPILKSGISFRSLVSENVLLHTSQWYGCYTVCTRWCTFRICPPDYFITNITAIWMLPYKYMLMYLQPTCVPECFITPITAIWMLPSMYTLMYLHTIRFTECFITPIREIWNLSQNVHADKFYVDRASLCNLVNKSCTKLVSFTGIHADVPSEYLCPRMFYYTNYSNMEATQNVHVDVPSGYFWYWKIYYTHHRDMYIPQHVTHVIYIYI